MKMTTILICVILFFGGATGGFLTDRLIEMNTPAKTNIVNIANNNKNYTTVDSENKNYQAQIQITAVDSKGFITNIGINLKDITNSVTNLVSVSNSSESITNGKLSK